MDWGTVAILLAQYGIPLTEKLISKWESKGEVSLQEWQSLKADASMYAKDRMVGALQRAGIDPSSEQGKILLSLTNV